MSDTYKSTYSEKALDLVANTFCDSLSNHDIRKIIWPLIRKNIVLTKYDTVVDYFKNWSDEYPFCTFNDVLQAIRINDVAADKTISAIIEALLHPLNYDADEKKAGAVADKIAQYIKYDNFCLANNTRNSYVVTPSELTGVLSSQPKPPKKIVDTKMLGKVAYTEIIPQTKIQGDFLTFDKSNIPIEKGQKKIAQLFLSEAKIYRDEKVTRRGTEIDIKRLMEASGYADEASFRDGLKRLRKKLREAFFPIEIENTQTGKYQMVIRYFTTQKP